MSPSLAPVIVGWVVLVGAALFAWSKGGPAERLGATLKVFTSATALTVHHTLKLESISVALLVADGLLAIGFLLLAVRYVSLWLGAAMILQGAQFSLHAYYLVAERSLDRLYSIINNVNTYGVILCILAGTLIAWRRRVRMAQAA